MKKQTHTGFTLIEMIVVLAIFMIMTSIVIFNHNKFTSETILTNMAYEVALSVREAQIYGVSVRSPQGVPESEAFEKEYGIHFPKVVGGSSNYYLFSDVNGNGTFDMGTSCVSGTGECVTPYTLQRGVKISYLTVKNASGCSDSAITNGGNLSVLFRRPDPEPLFNDDNTSFEFAEITLRAPDGALRYVVVRNNGQIYVDNVSSCLATP
jgi:prepilin-type N-terminal cleavage/methylation domain-containing protein